MKITKLGHCCLLIEEQGLRILTDPGSYTVEEQKSLNNLDVILITHEHQDHLHIESLKVIFGNNPNVILFTNKGVAKILDSEGIKYELLEHNQSKTINGVLFEGFGEVHAEIYRTRPIIINTSYFISNRFFYPGDALYNPQKPVEILALPVAGPWLKLSEAIDYAREVKPKICFPVHEGMIKTPGTIYRLPNEILTSEGIQFTVIEPGNSSDF